jgi:hypothetical protein
LGEGAISLYCDPLQELSISKVKKLLPAAALSFAGVGFEGDQQTDFGARLRDQAAPGFQTPTGRGPWSLAGAPGSPLRGSHVFGYIRATFRRPEREPGAAATGTESVGPARSSKRGLGQ